MDDSSGYATFRGPQIPAAVNRQWRPTQPEGEQRHSALKIERLWGGIRPRNNGPASPPNYHKELNESPVAGN
ncbi:hypothetical protein BDV26DRAFT_276889 [Aspergillus bertholletiae]|uniref:Uncharacterized protein n=1 Tax=Aspergillus bertholletiae TaxID=1226010 RepID=A0A5N7APU7_9EURO|nr:hypothetical protein BDV26DRAFT_276889 [Aspergillus bertholletiae]